MNCNNDWTMLMYGKLTCTINSCCSENHVRLSIALLKTRPMLIYRLRVYTCTLWGHYRKGNQFSLVDLTSLLVVMNILGCSPSECFIAHCLLSCVPILPSHSFKLWEPCMNPWSKWQSKLWCTLRSLFPLVSSFYLYPATQFRNKLILHISG